VWIARARVRIHRLLEKNKGAGTRRHARFYFLLVLKRARGRIADVEWLDLFGTLIPAGSLCPRQLLRDVGGDTRLDRGAEQNKQRGAQVPPTRRGRGLLHGLSTTARRSWSMASRVNWGPDGLDRPPGCARFAAGKDGLHVDAGAGQALPRREAGWGTFAGRRGTKVVPANGDGGLNPDERGVGLEKARIGELYCGEGAISNGRITAKIRGDCAPRGARGAVHGAGPQNERTAFVGGAPGQYSGAKAQLGLNTHFPWGALLAAPLWDGTLLRQEPRCGKGYQPEASRFIRTDEGTER